MAGWHRAGRSHRVRQRAHAVLLSAKGYTLDEIADVREIDRDAVSRTLDRWQRGGSADWEEAPRPGRTPKGDAALEAEVGGGHPGESRRLAPHAGKKEVLDLACHATLKKVLHRARCRWRRNRRRTDKPLVPHRVAAVRKALVPFS